MIVSSYTEQPSLVTPQHLSEEAVKAGAEASASQASGEQGAQAHESAGEGDHDSPEEGVKRPAEEAEGDSAAEVRTWALSAHTPTAFV